MKELEKLDKTLEDEVQEYLQKKRYIEGYIDCLATVRARLRRIIEEQKKNEVQK